MAITADKTVDDSKTTQKAITKKKLEWSKIFTAIIAFVIGIYGIWCGIEYYKLCRIAVEKGASFPDSDLAVTCVTVVLASLLSYCLYQGALKLSLNKHGLTVDKVSGVVKSIQECEFLDAVENTVENDEKLES